MGRLALIVAAAALVSGAAGSAAPVPVETRAAAILELQAAIEDEQRALELLKRTPPRVQTARDRLYRSADRLNGIYDFLSATPGAAAAQQNIGRARSDDYTAANLAPGRKGIPRAIEFLERALERKREALPLVRTAKPAAGVSQCSDGKDNDSDGITDWKLEPGCTSSQDVRESSPFSCEVQSAIESGRLALSGSCSGVFSEVEFTLLDGVQLNGPYDVMHAPSCSPPQPQRVRCKTKEGDKNPKHLIDARFATTSKDPNQRVQLRFFDVRKRQIGRFVVPPIVPQTP